MAAVSEQARVNFNPEWMRSTYSGNAKNGQNTASSPSFGSPGGGGAAIYCGSAANNADGQVLAPAKLAKNRYGREEMLGLFTGSATVAPPELKPTFPEFYIDPPQDPICMLPLSDVEERLLIQGGINSSKVINVVNHAERAMRWPQRSFGRGAVGGEGPPGYQTEVPGEQKSAVPFVVARPPGAGVGRGVGRGSYQMPGGFDPMARPPTRFIGVGRGRGDGRGRGFERLPGGFGGPGAFGGGQGQNDDNFAPQNTRAQGLYDPNDPRDRPRQRQKSTSRTDDLDDAPSQIRAGPNDAQRRSYTAVRPAVPEWALDDDETLADDAVGTFDASGQFQELAAPTTVETVKENDATKHGEAQLNAKPAQLPPAPVTSMTSVPASGPQHNVPGRSIPVETLFGAAHAPLPETVSNVTSYATGGQETLSTPNSNQPAAQARRLPKAFATLGLQDSQKLDVGDSNKASNDYAVPVFQVNPGVPNAGKQRPKGIMQDGPFPPQQYQAGQIQPKFVVPKSISSSSEGVFSKLHDDVESLVNSLSADDMPSVVHSHKLNNTASNLQQQTYGVGISDRSAIAPQGPMAVRNVSSSAPLHFDNASSNQVANQKWYYKDPQGDLRGAFDSTQMAAWFAAGYFTMTLLVRRAEDTKFVPLGDLIKKYGRIPFVPSTSSSTADTPSPNPMSAPDLSAMTAGDSSSPIVQPAARYGVAAGRSDASSVHGALSNLTGGGAFHKTANTQHAFGMNPNSNSGGLWDIDLPSATVPTAQPPHRNDAQPAVNPDMQAQLNVLSQMLQKERDEEPQRRAEEKERQRKIEEAKQAKRREEERQRALLKEKEEELKRLQEAREEGERRRKEAEEEAKRQEKKQLEEQQRRLEELAKKEAEERKRKTQEEEERRKKAKEEKRRLKAQEEQLRKERETKEALESERKEQAKKAAAIEAAWEKQHEQQRKEEENRKKRSKKSAAPWTQQQQKQETDDVASNGSARSLAEIQKEEERQMVAEMQQKVELDIQRKKELDAANVQLGSAWGGSAAAAAKLKWDQQSSMAQPGRGGPAWGGKGEVQPELTGSCGLWDEEDAPLSAPQKAKNPKSNQSNAAKKSKQSVVTAAASTKKDENVKKLFQRQQATTDDFTAWCIKQLKSFNSDIDAITFVSFLKEVEPPAEVEEYIVSYCGDTRGSRDFMKAFLEKRNGLRKAASLTKTQVDDLSTPAPALNPTKAFSGENVPPNAADKSAAGGKKKKATKSTGRFVDGSILGFKATADPNRLNAGEIDNPM